MLISAVLAVFFIVRALSLNSGAVVYLCVITAIATLSDTVMVTIRAIGLVIIMILITPMNTIITARASLPVTV